MRFAHSNRYILCFGLFTFFSANPVFSQTKSAAIVEKSLNNASDGFSSLSEILQELNSFGIQSTPGGDEVKINPIIPLFSLDKGKARHNLNVCVFDGVLYIGEWNQSTIDRTSARILKTWLCTPTSANTWHRAVLPLNDTTSTLQDNRLKENRNSVFFFNESNSQFEGYNAPITIGGGQGSQYYEQGQEEGTDIEYLTKTSEDGGDQNRSDEKFASKGSLNFTDSSMLKILNCKCLTFSSLSIQGWGQAKGFYHVSVGGVVQVHWFQNTQPRLAENNLQSSFGVSYRVRSKILEAGVLLTNRGFPTEKSTQLNFIADAGYSFERFRISYSHISNGFGIWNKFNDGVDTINIRIKL